MSNIGSRLHKGNGAHASRREVVNRNGRRPALNAASGRRKYKELTSQQLRSFYESARLGSFSEAARHLGLAHPTVWEQVRALEKHIGKELFESRGKRLHLTGEGKTFFELASPLVLGMASLPQRFRRGDVGSRCAACGGVDPQDCGGRPPRVHQGIL